MKDLSEKLEAVEESQEDHFTFPSVRALQLVPQTIFNTNIQTALAVQGSKTERADEEKQRHKLFTHKTSDSLPKTEDRISYSTV